MELVVAFVAALLGLSVAFFLSISFYDHAPEGWLRLGRRRTVTFDGGAMLPRSIQHTSLD